MSKFAEGVTPKQLQLARAFQKAGLTSYSQAVKAFQRRENERIEEWKRQLQGKQEKQ